MIDLLTGLPGNAKTLFGLELWIARAVAENRPVYYSGLKEFKEDDPRLGGSQWVEFDPMRWHIDVPSNSLIFIDEGQKTFRNRSMGAVPPLHVTELEEHRHKGLDFLIITQHPSLIDPAIRRLSQTHRHMVRIFGMEASTVHKWNGVKDNCDKSRADSESSKWGFNKKLYGLYKSADAHTMKRSIPLRVKLLFLVPVLLVAAGWYVTKVLTKKPVLPASQVGAAGFGTPGLPGALGMPAAGPQAARFDPMADARQFVAMNTPRVVGLPQTAPKYDELTKPVRVPVPAACIVRLSKSDCHCYSQQGTPMDVSYTMCVGFAHDGFFQDFDPDRAKVADDRATSSSHVLSSSTPDAPVPIHQAAAKSPGVPVS